LSNTFQPGAWLHFVSWTDRAQAVQNAAQSRREAADLQGKGQPMNHAMQSRRARILQHAALLAMLVSPLLASAAPPAPSKCKLAAVVQVPIDMKSLRPMVAAAIDGHPSNMLIDTGSSTSLIFRGAATAFGLKIVERGGKGYTAGGIEQAGKVDVRDFDVGGFVVHNLTLATMGHGSAAGAAAGLLGEDFLSHWDEEFDPTAGVMRLMVPKDCSGDQVVYWAPQYSVVKLVSVASRDADWSGHLLADVQLNGHDVLAMFDTGAPYSIVTTGVAQRPGLQPTIEAATGRQIGGLGRAHAALDAAVFPSITIGQETIQNPRMEVADIFARNKQAKRGSMIASSPEGEPEMLIGMDFFRAHRVYVARGQKKMYFTYLGGAVFLTSSELNARAQPAAPPGASSGPATPAPTAPPAGDTPNPVPPQ
jgi:predicted aspartyl protease